MSVEISGGLIWINRQIAPEEIAGEGASTESTKRYLFVLKRSMYLRLQNTFFTSMREYRSGKAVRTVI